MKKILALLLAALMLTGVLVSCTPADPVDTDDVTGTDDTTTETPDTTPADTEPAEPKEPYEEEIVMEYDGYTVTLSEPVVVFQGAEGDDEWGHTNFPRLYRTQEGYLRVSWFYGEDKVGGSGTTNTKVSVNEGKNWLPLNKGSSTAAPSLEMSNGKCWSRFITAGDPDSAELAAQIPDSEKVKLERGMSLIFEEDLAKYDLAKELKLLTLSMEEYDPATDTYKTYPCTVNWPNKAVLLYSDSNIFYPVSTYFGKDGGNVIVTEDGTMYNCFYAIAFDANAATREEALTDYTRYGYSSVYVFESTDCGRTWDYLAQFTSPAGTEGFSEPEIIEMPDGSLFVLMRSGMTEPMYSAVSHDKGRTWSEPAEFDYCGVFPQLLGLDCGVTIATYGRPDLLVRTTDDPTGENWDEHIEIPLANDSKNYMRRSCFYTDLMPIDENSAWFCYTDFMYPNRKGVPVKSVLLRKITVTITE